MIRTSPATMSAAELLFLAAEVKDGQREVMRTACRNKPQSQQKGFSIGTRSVLCLTYQYAFWTKHYARGQPAPCHMG